MTAPATTPWFAARYRLSPLYTLLPFAQLPRAQQRVFRDLRQDPAVAELLVPSAGGGAGVRAVDHATADLLRAMRTAGALPAEAVGSLGAAGRDAVARLVLDGVLEIECEGRFLAGAAAIPVLATGPAPRPAGRIGALSLEALTHAAALALGDARAVAARLYRYNSCPASPRWRSRLSTPDAVAEFLGARRTGDAAVHRRWLAWQVRGTRPEPVAGTIYKLYVSPAIEHTGAALGAVLTHLGRRDAFEVKVGRDLFGLLRPDKLVAYFACRDDLERCAAALATELAGMPAHGVPFTAELGGDGLLSWGVDPANHSAMLRFLGAESWRGWITARLAAALVSAGVTGSAARPPQEFALERLYLDGVDTASFAPIGGIWPGPGGT
jgi:hypothetical protein